jgi:hypothetical protein
LKTGHYKHWLVDRRQQLWYAIAGKKYLPEWINALEMADTPERFGIVPLSSEFGRPPGASARPE